jgi:hypothetical protein
MKDKYKYFISSALVLIVIMISSQFMVMDRSVFFNILENLNPFNNRYNLYNSGLEIVNININRKHLLNLLQGASNNLHEVKGSNAHQLKNGNEYKLVINNLKMDGINNLYKKKAFAIIYKEISPYYENNTFHLLPLNDTTYSDWDFIQNLLRSSNNISLGGKYVVLKINGINQGVYYFKSIISKYFLNNNMSDESVVYDFTNFPTIGNALNTNYWNATPSFRLINKLSTKIGTCSICGDINSNAFIKYMAVILVSGNFVKLSDRNLNMVYNTEDKYLEPILLKIRFMKLNDNWPELLRKPDYSIINEILSTDINRKVLYFELNKIVQKKDIISASFNELKHTYEVAIKNDLQKGVSYRQFIQQNIMLLNIIKYNLDIIEITLSNHHVDTSVFITENKTEISLMFNFRNRGLFPVIMDRIKINLEGTIDEIQLLIESKLTQYNYEQKNNSHYVIFKNGIEVPWTDDTYVNNVILKVLKNLDQVIILKGVTTYYTNVYTSKRIERQEGNKIAWINKDGY